MRWYIGWDPRDAVAYEVAAASLIKHASIPVEVVALKDWELRARGLYWRDYYVAPNGQMWDRRDDRPFSTAFSYTRFAVPLIEDYGEDVVGYADADMLWRADVAELVPLIVSERQGAALACVRHDHAPAETVKMTGNVQRRYARKNWSSLMLLRPDRCRALTPYALNNMSHDWLHGFCWLPEREIAALPEAWNWLEGWSSPGIAPKVVHFTRGTPDMPGYAAVAFADEWRQQRTENRGQRSEDSSAL